jgi:hypothetical protein
MGEKDEMRKCNGDGWNRLRMKYNGTGEEKEKRKSLKEKWSAANCNDDVCFEPFVVDGGCLRMISEYCWFVEVFSAECKDTF